MPIVEPLSIDISGTWSHRQARAVIDALARELEHKPFRLVFVDVSTHQTPHRAIISMQCLYHGCHIEPDSACEMCMAGVKS